MASRSVVEVNALRDESSRSECPMLAGYPAVGGTQAGQLTQDYGAFGKGGSERPLGGPKATFCLQLSCGVGWDVSHPSGRIKTDWSNA